MDHVTKFAQDLKALEQARLDTATNRREYLATFADAERRRSELAGDLSLRVGLSASVENALYAKAPAWHAHNQQAAAAWGLTPMRNHTLLLDETLQSRVLTTASGGTEIVSTAQPLVVAAAHNTADAFLALMTNVTARDAAGNQLIGRLDTLPAGSVLATETTNATDTTHVATQSILAPKSIVTFSKWSRHFALQSEAGAEAVVRLNVNGAKNKLLQQIAAGSGSNNEMVGLLNHSSVPTTNGTTLTWAMVADTISDVEANSSGENLAWLVTATAAEVMRQRAAISGGAAILDGNNRIGGYPAFVTGCSTAAFAVFGAWRDLMLFQFAPIEVGLDPYGVNSANFQAQLVSARCWISADAAPLLTGSFSTLHSIT